jgi:hypothetical protein
VILALDLFGCAITGQETVAVPVAVDAMFFLRGSGEGRARLHHDCCDDDDAGDFFQHRQGS